MTPPKPIPIEYDLSWPGNDFVSEEFLRDALVTSANTSIFSRKEPQASDRLRRALSDLYGLQQDWYLIGAGATQILEAVVGCFASSNIIDITPNFGACRRMAILLKCGYNPVYARMDSHIIEKVTSVGIKGSVLFLSSPRNPFGNTVDLSVIKYILAQDPIALVVDETYADFTGSSCLHLVADNPNLIVVRSFSKVWNLSGLRVGYGVSSGLSSLINRHIPACSVANVCADVATHLTRFGQGVLQQSIAALVRERDLFSLELSVFNGWNVLPSQSNFIFCELPDAKCLLAQLKERGLRATRCATMFSDCGISNVDGIRFAIKPGSRDFFRQLSLTFPLQISSPIYA